MDKERKPHKHTEAATSSPLLSIRRLSAAYDGRTVLHDVDLEVYEHDFLGIIGPNGGGKTTLIKCILGLLRPTGGEIIKYHEPLTTGYLPQYNSIDRSFPISVLEVVLSGLSSKKSLMMARPSRARCSCPPLSCPMARCSSPSSPMRWITCRAFSR